VIVEGFLVFSVPEILSQLDILIYVTIDKLTCSTRRNGEPDYFEKVLWPSYLLHNRPVLEILDRLFVVDGTKSKSQVVGNVVEYLRGAETAVSERELLINNLN
jgi:hypothetical protein